VANALPLHQKASSDHCDRKRLDPARSAHMVNPRKDSRETLHALLAVYVQRPGID
jgi:hypothetical protein